MYKKKSHTADAKTCLWVEPQPLETLHTWSAREGLQAAAASVSCLNIVSLRGALGVGGRHPVGLAS